MSFLDRFRTPAAAEQPARKTTKRQRALKARRQARWRAKRAGDKPFHSEQPTVAVQEASPAGQDAPPVTPSTPETPRKGNCPVCGEYDGPRALGYVCGRCHSAKLNQKPGPKCIWCNQPAVERLEKPVDGWLCAGHQADGRALVAEERERNLHTPAENPVDYLRDPHEEDSVAAQAGSHALPPWDLHTAIYESQTTEVESVCPGERRERERLIQQAKERGTIR